MVYCWYDCDITTGSLTGCCDELLVVAYRRVVDEGVGDHVGRLTLSIVGVCWWCLYGYGSSRGWVEVVGSRVYSSQ